jgi:hypothetical protein
MRVKMLQADLKELNELLENERQSFKESNEANVTELNNLKNGKFCIFERKMNFFQICVQVFVNLVILKNTR